MQRLASRGRAQAPSPHGSGRAIVSGHGTLFTGPIVIGGCERTRSEPCDKRHLSRRYRMARIIATHHVISLRVRSIRPRPTCGFTAVLLLTEAGTKPIGPIGGEQPPAITHGPGSEQALSHRRPGRGHARPRPVHPTMSQRHAVWKVHARPAVSS
jgi:hypothetical protein